MSMRPADVMKMVKDEKVVMVDFKFCDLLGKWQHFSIPTEQLTEDVFEEGLGFDGSSIRGWKAIHSSDMMVLPDVTTAQIDPFMSHPTLSLICTILDPITRERYNKDPRCIAQNCEAYLKSTGIADTAYFGPEAEFFIFDSARFHAAQECAYYYIDSIEAAWNMGRDEDPNLAHKVRNKEGYFPVPPSDQFQDLRTEMSILCEKMGMIIERQHHEVATAGQAEIDMKFDSLVKCADNLMRFKYVIKNAAAQAGRTVTFMPKPLYGDNGSGMHVHQSLWKGGKPLFAGDGYAGMSEMAMHYIGGVLKHSQALAAFAASTTNSYKRLVPGFEAPVNLAYSSRNRSAAIRIPMYSPSPKAKRIEVRYPDPMANGYLLFSAFVMAGLDGIQNKIDPGDPLDKDIYALTPEELKDVPSMPGSLEVALNALKEDNAFLLKGDVFSEEFISTWIDYKMEKEVNEMRKRPNALEFVLYYDA
ncbi:MAG: type I glutamate--ammonia ligase [Myxococcales bacterium]|nr:type I glutamate--ammonia ligase [Myxococcales bacterium]